MPGSAVEQNSGCGQDATVCPAGWPCAKPSQSPALRLFLSNLNLSESRWAWDMKRGELWQMRRDMKDTQGSHHFSKKTKSRETASLSTGQSRLLEGLSGPGGFTGECTRGCRQPGKRSQLQSMSKVPGLKLLLRRTEDVLHQIYRTFVVADESVSCMVWGYQMALPLLSPH